MEYKRWIDIYSEVKSEVENEYGSAQVSVELSRRLYDRYKPVDDERRFWKFKGGGE